MIQRGWILSPGKSVLNAKGLAGMTGTRDLEGASELTLRTETRQAPWSLCGLQRRPSLPVGAGPIPQLNRRRSLCVPRRHRPLNISPFPTPTPTRPAVRVPANSMPRRSASLLREEKKLSPKGLQDPSCLPWPTQRLAMRLDPEGDGSQGVKEKAGWGCVC